MPYLHKMPSTVLSVGKARGSTGNLF